ncbi:MAG: response regulator transcription factor [Coriobacteriia bacterium]
MHMRKVLVATDDDHTAAWVRSALAGLDVTLEVVPLRDREAWLGASDHDLVVLDAGPEPQRTLDTVADALASVPDRRLLVLLELEALTGLRVPSRPRTDFVVRGGSREELAARARILLWDSGGGTGGEILRSGDLVLNLATYQAYTSKGPIDLTYQEYALLSYLMTHPDRAHSRESLLSRVWGTDYFGGARTVDVHVRRVRSKLGPESARRLRTIRGVGYMWSSEG